MAMAAVAAEIEAEQGQDLIEIEVSNPVKLFTDKEAFENLYSRVKEEAAKAGSDVSTKAGRERIRATAHKISRTKAAIDKARLGLTEEWRNQIAKVNESGKEITAKFDDLRAEVRKPLTEWEDAEDARKQRCSDILTKLASAATITLVDTVETVKARLDEVQAIEIEAAEFDDLTEQAMQRQEHAVAQLQLGLSRLEQEERDRAELQRLRDAEEQRKQEEAERAERERIAAEEKAAEEKRVADAEAARKAEAERIERERNEAAAAATREAEEKARAAEAEREAARQAEIDAANERARVAEEARQAEAKRLEEERIEAERKAAAEKAEQERREADLAHRQKIMGEVKQAIMTCGVTEEQAKAIVLSITGGNVPHTKITF